MKPIRSAPKAIIVENGRLLALKMRDAEGLWYILPGGGQHVGETLDEALKRECREELGVDVEVGQLRFVRDYIGKNHEFADEDSDAHQVECMFECRIIDAAGLGNGTDPDPGQVGVEWLPAETLEEYRLYPKALRPLIKHMDTEPLPIYMGDVN
jgi:8-oxo-dGTP pyrophosphatase MutT (NUDIX family)